MPSKYLYLLNVTLTAAVLTSSPTAADAQTDGPPAPPNVNMIDENFVNYASGVTMLSIPMLSLGSGDLGMAFTGYFNSGAWLTGTNLTATYEYDRNGHEIISFGPNSDTRLRDSGSTLQKGGLLTMNSDNSRTVLLRDGTRLEFASNALSAHRATFPNGKVISYNGWLSFTHAASAFQNNGLLLKQYADGTAVLINTAYEYCDPSPEIRCSLGQSWPTASQSVRTQTNRVATTHKDVWNTVTDQAGGRYELEAVQGMLTKFSDKLSTTKGTRTYERCTVKPVNCYYTYSSAGVGSARTTQMTQRVISTQRRGNKWSFNYTWNVGPYGSLYTGTGPSGNKRAHLESPRLGFGYVASFSDTKGSYSFDGLNRVTSASIGGAATQIFEYDSRSNLVSITYAPRDGSVEAQKNIKPVAKFAYDEICTDMAKCNRPNSYTDEKNQRTDYLYDIKTGQIVRESKPAVNGIRSVIRYSYTSRRAWYLGPSGNYVPSPTGISLLASEKTCRTSETVGDGCASANDEIVTTYDYGPDSGPNNLWLRGVTVSANGVKRLTCYEYDRLGNRVREISPRVNLRACY